MKKVFIIADERFREQKRLLAQFLGDHEILATSTEEKAQAVILINPAFDEIANARKAHTNVIVVKHSATQEFVQKCVEYGADHVVISDMGAFGWARKIANILGE